MKVLVCSNLFPLEMERSGDGVTLAVRQLVEGAQRHGIDVRQIIRFKPLITDKGLQWPRATRSGQFEVLDTPRIGTRRVFSGTLTRLALAGAGRVEKPDVIVCHMVDSFVPARKVFRHAGAKFVFVLHAPDLENDQLAECLENADAVFCRSEALRRQLADRTGHQAQGVVFSGVAESDFGTDAKDLSGETTRIVIAAVFVPFKNIQSTLQALKLLEQRLNFSVDIYGDGPLRSEIASLVAELQLQHKVVLHGFRPKPEILRAMRDAHLFVLPSAPETFGLTFLEAMANGCVVIGHRGWGVDGIVQDGVNGYLAESAAPAHIAAKIMAYRESDRAAMHRRSHETARNHTADAAAANYARLTRSAA